ncbi:MAG: 3-alpha-hydroxysteroid dehydrogenase [Deltaproteobacteria bacterium]|nr:3-alpha-hydroxysteroid dehydrogenase [Deltaproteobacteria bacterium]
MFRLDDRVALVTGAARGVGATIAKTLAQAGAKVVLADILVAEGEKVAAAIGDGARFESLDVTKEEDWTRAVDSTLGALGRIDVLVNNAAVLHMGCVENTPPDVFRRLLEVNTVGPYLGTRAVLSAMKSQGKGSIVMISSIDGLVGMNAVSAYSASKFGVRGFAKATAMELGRSGIRVNSVCAAGGGPEMTAPWLDKMMPFLEHMQAYMDDRGIPGGVPVEQIANAVHYLASDASDGVTGIDLPVDGGATAGKWIEGFNTL